MRRGLVHLYIGNGKGKTTAALGLILRALGAKKKACFVQFLKAKISSEISVLKNLNVKTILFKERHPLFYKTASIEKLKQKIEQDLKKTGKVLKDKKFDIVVLDEILYLAEKRLIKEDEILRIIRSKPKRTELILTGGIASARIKRLADYISIIASGKHPFQKSIICRRGIEY